ncbi:MAG: DinB family protein [Methanoregulaceae archaeon]|nr:DinB family protein [Methanoregulaceae archaeon]
MILDVAPDTDAHPQLGLLIATLEDSTREWRENLGRVSQAAVVWQPYENGPSIGGVILHLVDAETWWLRCVGAQEPDDATTPEAMYNRDMDLYKAYWPAPPRKPLSWYLDLLVERRAVNLDYIRSQAEAAEVISRGSKNAYTYRWIVAHLVEHDSYHGGQAVLLHEMFKRMRKLNR